MSRFWKIALIVVVVLGLGVVAVRLLHKPGAPHGGPGDAQAEDGPNAKNPPVPVTVVPVERRDVPVYLTALGTVQALNTVAVSPQVGGRLLSVDFTEGQEVKKGQVLARIDPRTFQATYDQAVARMHQDQALLATARGNLSRSRELGPKGYISKQDLDNLSNTVEQQKALVAADEAAVRDAKVQLDYTEVLAPIDGLAGIRGVDPGNVVTTTSTLVTLTQLHPINVMFTLPEQDLEMVRSAAGSGGAALAVTALDRGDAHVIADGGVLKVIDNQIDPGTGTFRLKSQFDNAHKELWPGQFVNVRLKVRTVGGGLVIPAQAVQRGPDGDYVYLLQPDKTVRMQTVVVAQEVGDTDVMIGSGLDAGQKVVTEGQFRLKPGSKVNPLRPGEVPKVPGPEDKKVAQKKASRGNGGSRH